MPQDLRDQWWVLDAGDHTELATARANGTSAWLLALCANRHAALACALGKFDVDGEDPFEPLYPTHGCHGLVMLHRAQSSLRHDAITMLEVRCEHPVKPGQIQSWPGNQCSQTGNKIQRFQHDMGRSIPEGMFVAVNDPAPAALAVLQGARPLPESVPVLIIARWGTLLLALLVLSAGMVGIRRLG
jgi:hypothetical protein